MKINESARKILNDKALLNYHKSWFARLQALFDGKESEPFPLMGVPGFAQDPGLIYREPEVWMKQALEDLAQKAEQSVSEKRFVPLCVESALYGVHFIDKILGAEVFYKDDQWYNKYLLNEVGQLSEPDLDNDETWKLAKRVAEAFLEQKVSVPLFGLPTIASALNIGVNLYGEEMLVAMLAEPEAARHDLKIINDLLIKIHTWYRKNIPEQQLQPVISWERAQPYGYGQLCGCTTQLISAGLYKEFIYDLDNSLLGVYPHGGMIHLCGSHEHLIPLFAEMENLKSIQLNDRAAEGIAEYLEGLRENQIIYLNPCEKMTIEQGKRNAAGRRLVIVSAE